MPTVKEFLLESDFHGVRFVVNPSLSQLRRTLWLLVIIASLLTLGWLIVVRVQYYFSYPSSNAETIDYNVIPAPAISICPFHTGLYIPHDFDDYETLSDSGIIFLLSQSGMDILREDGSNTRQNGNYRVKEEAKEIAKHTRLMHQNDAGYIAKVMVECMQMFYWEGFCAYFNERLANISSSIEVNVETGYPTFLREFGIRKEHVKECIVESGEEVTNCRQYMREVLTSSGACVVLDNMNNTNIYFREHQIIGSRNRIRIELTLEYAEAAIYLYDPDDLLDALYGSIQRSTSDSTKAMLTQVTSYQSLGLPYDGSCSEARRSHCMRDCLLAESHCRPYFISGGGEKPVCKPNKVQAHVNRSVTLKCGQMCIASCYKREYAVDEKVESGITIMPDQNGKHVVSVHVPLYTVGSLLAELGGTVGLFIGASALGLYHLVEFMARKLWSSLIKSPTRKDTNTHNL